jgi:hypothetical protein
MSPTAPSPMYTMCNYRIPATMASHLALIIDVPAPHVDVPGLPCPVPSVLRHDLQWQPVSGVNTRQEWHWSHTWQHFKRSKGVKRNGILECKCLSKNAHRARLIQCRDSLGSMMLSIANSLANAKALPRAYALATNFSYSSCRSTFSVA